MVSGSPRRLTGQVRSEVWSHLFSLLPRTNRGWRFT